MMPYGFPMMPGMSFTQPQAKKKRIPISKLITKHIKPTIGFNQLYTLFEETDEGVYNCLLDGYRDNRWLFAETFRRKWNAIPENQRPLQFCRVGTRHEVIYGYNSITSKWEKLNRSDGMNDLISSLATYFSSKYYMLIKERDGRGINVMAHNENLGNVLMGAVALRLSFEPNSGSIPHLCISKKELMKYIMDTFANFDPSDYDDKYSSEEDNDDDDDDGASA